MVDSTFCQFLNFITLVQDTQKIETNYTSHEFVCYKTTWTTGSSEINFKNIRRVVAFLYFSIYGVRQRGLNIREFVIGD